MNIYTSIDRTPYTYLIGWTDLDVWYYGRRTAKGCHPEELFITYFTSSNIVDDVRAEYGEPDVIKVHKYFSTIDACKKQEERFLKRVGAAKNPRFLNLSNGDLKWDGTGKIAVCDRNENYFSVSVDDPRYISGELVPYRKNKVLVKDKFNQNFLVDKTDPRYISGELIAFSVGAIPWCAGLTKETDDRINQASIKRSKTTKGKPTRPHSESRKRNISKSRIKLKSKWYTNKIIEICIPENEIVPFGFIEGRLPQGIGMKKVCRIKDKKEMDIGNYSKWIKSLNL